jgi:hypothetical protein
MSKIEQLELEDLDGDLKTEIEDDPKGAENPEFKRSASAVTGASKDDMPGKAVSTMSSSPLKRGKTIASKSNTGLEDGKEEEGEGGPKLERSATIKGKGGGGEFEYISKEELEKTMEAVPLPEFHTETLKECVSLSVKDFYKNFFEDDGIFPQKKFWVNRGEGEVQNFGWKQPSQDYSEVEDPHNSNKFNPDFAAVSKISTDTEVWGKPILSQRSLCMQYQVKGNPMVKVAPTMKTYQIVEHSDTKLLIRVKNEVINVPYCDSFATDEYWCVTSVAGNCPASCFRFSLGL